jgi:hypothetical protein
VVPGLFDGRNLLLVPEVHPILPLFLLLDRNLRGSLIFVNGK